MNAALLERSQGGLHVGHAVALQVMQDDAQLKHCYRMDG